ncbi:hypothetical protein HYW59_03685 [Candidatus Kaiserbacteria bacterium]|nr:hypothetical protein [Candidatus Kaiserbacteria bacterium]
MTRYEAISTTIVIAIFAMAFALSTLFTAVHAASTTPSILDSLPVPMQKAIDTTSHSFEYTVPSGGTNKLLIALISKNDCPTAPISATQNGTSLTISGIPGTFNRACYYVGYLANPSTGPFEINFVSATFADYAVFTLQDAAQSSSVDVSNVTFEGSQSSNSTSVTTTVGNTLLLSLPKWETATWLSYGAGETEFMVPTTSDMGWTAGSFKSAASTAGTETMTINISSAREADEPVVAVKPATNDIPSVPANACDTPTVAPAGYTLMNGGPGRDTVTLSSFTMFVGKGGNDKVIAGNGDFIICLGDGNDTVKIGAGVSVISAGAGKNTVLAGNGNKIVTAGDGDDQIKTGNGDDTISAGGGKNKVFAGAGEDTVTTLGGNDFIDGGPDFDTCNAGGGTNTVLNC